MIENRHTRLLIFFATCVAAWSQSAHKPAKRGAPTAKLGIQTPGVQIPFANLKAETEFPAPSKPRWVAIADQVYFPGADFLQPIDPKAKDAKLAAPIAGLKQPCGGAISAFGHLWIALCGENALGKYKTNPISKSETKEKTGLVSQVVLGPFGAQPALASTDDSVWVLADRKTSLFRIDPETVEVVAEMRLPAACSSIIFAEKSLWVACPDSDRVLRIDPRTNVVEKSIKLTTPRSLAFGEGSVWVYCQKEGAVERIDPKTNKSSKSISLGTPGLAGEIAFGEGFVWVTSPGFPLARIDTKDEKVAQQLVGTGGGAIAVGQGWIWLVNIDAGTLWKIDPKRVIATLAE